MPVTKSAKKALKQDRKRAIFNQRARREYRSALKAFRDKPTASSFSKLSSELDRAVKKKSIHQNKASRLKARLSKLLPKQAKKRHPVKTSKKSS